MSRLTACVFLAVYVVGIATSSDFAHFTWWGILAGCLHETGIIIQRPPGSFGESWRDTVRPNSWLCILLVHSSVAMGVVMMSGMKCSMLSQALHDNGAAVYTAGNFALHYMPLVRTIYCTPAVLENAYKQCTSSAAISVAYTLVEVPTHVYGCYMNSSLVVGAFAAMSLLQLVVVVPSLSIFFRDCL